jgi:hypothetical protein
MTKPFVNLDEVQFEDIEENGYYTSKRALLGANIGARKLGYNLTELPPGKAQCPFHSHREEEEMFLILEGEGELRFGEQRFKLRRHDVIACPTGWGRGRAPDHQYRWDDDALPVALDRLHNRGLRVSRLSEDWSLREHITDVRFAKDVQG